MRTSNMVIKTETTAMICGSKGCAGAFWLKIVGASDETLGALVLREGANVGTDVGVSVMHGILQKAWNFSEPNSSLQLTSEQSPLN